MRADSTAARLIDLIHRARLGQRSWRTVLFEASRLAPEGRAVLAYRDAASGGGSCALSSGFDRQTSEAYAEHYAWMSPIRGAISASPVGRVASYDHLIAPQSLRRSRFYNEFLRPLGIESGFVVTLRREGPGNYIFALTAPRLREAERERIRRDVQALVKPIQQAFAGPWPGFGATRLGEPAEARYPGRDGVLRVGPQGKVLYADDKALTLLSRTPELAIDGAGRLVCPEPAVDIAVEGALAGWNSGVAYSRLIHIRRAEEALPLRLTVLRPDADEAAFFRGAQCLLVLEDPAEGLAGAVEIFGALHGLTPAERRVVRGIVEGWTVSGIAARQGTAVDTVRRQLKQVFARTGLASQVDLARHVCLLAAAGPAGAAAADPAESGDSPPPPPGLAAAE